jgi:hypothetical protein
MSSFTVLSPAVYGRFRLIDARHGLDVETGNGGFVLDLDVKWRGVGVAGDTSLFRMGNPYVGARAGVESGPFVARAGLGVTLPLTNLYDDVGFDAAFTYVYGLALHGVWDIWLLYPQSFALTVPVDVAFRSEVFMVGGDGAFSVIASVPREGDASDPVVALQLGVYGAFLPIPELALGLRFQAVMISSDTPMSDAEGYLALVPFVRLNLEGGFVEARLYMNLDDPLGFAFDDYGYWSLSVSGGVDF